MNMVDGCHEWYGSTATGFLTDVRVGGRRLAPGLHHRADLALDVAVRGEGLLALQNADLGFGT